MRIVVGITGATGAPYAVTLLKVLRQMEVETHLVVSRWGATTLELECGLTATQLQEIASVSYAEDEMGAAISSGSFKTDGMVIIPCSMKTLGEVSNGVPRGLVGRAADVSLKEGRKLVVVPREVPLHRIHLENMLKVAQAGAVVLPPMPAFYNHPQTVQDIVNHTVSRVLDQFGIDAQLTKRWDGMPEE